MRLNYKQEYMKTAELLRDVIKERDQLKLKLEPLQKRVGYLEFICEKQKAIMERTFILASDIIRVPNP